MRRRSRRSQLLRDAGVPIAIASDCNPGTSPVLNPQLVMNMACTLFGLTPEEAIAGMTINAARALGLAHEVGTIEPGKAADLCVWQVSELSRARLLGRASGTRTADFRGPGCLGPARPLSPSFVGLDSPSSSR